MKRVNIIIDDGSKRNRHFIIPKFLIWIALPLIGIFFIVSIYSIFVRVSVEVDRQSLKKLRAENKLLKEKYKLLEDKIDSLINIIAVIEKHDIKLRVTNNIDVIDPDARELGMGGPKDKDIYTDSIKRINPANAHLLEIIDTKVEELNAKIKFEKSSFDTINQVISQKKYILDRTPSIYPCNGWLLSGFGYRIDPITRRIRMHNGVDIAGPTGTPIMASADGKIDFAGSRSGYGLSIEIDHEYGIKTFYAHLSAILVKQGQIVRRGEVIGLMGATGRTTGSHLHYEVRVNNVPVNPLLYMLNTDAVVD